MIRTLAASLLALTALSAGNALAIDVPPPGEVTKLQVYDGLEPGSCSLDSTPDASVKLGERITVYNGSSNPVTVTQRQGFWSVSVGVGAEKTVHVFGAGTYLSACLIGDWEAPLRARPAAPGSPTTNTFKVTWAVDAAPSTWRYGVQYRIGQGDWKQWKSGTSLRSSNFNGSNAKTYFFRARTIRPAADQKSDWSPARKVVT